MFLNVHTQHNWLMISHTFFIAFLFTSSWYLSLHKLHTWHVWFFCSRVTSCWESLIMTIQTNFWMKHQFVLLVHYFFFLLKYLHIFGAKQEKVKAVVAKSFFYFCRSVQCMYPFSGHFDVFWISGSLKNNETYSYRV